MLINTVTFGEIEIEKEKIITFENKILGFEEYNQFTIINSPDDETFYWLQSLQEPELSFIMVNPVSFVEDYNIIISDKIQNKMDIKSLEDIVVYTLVTIGKNGQYISTNLKAPIIINTKNNQAAQLVLDSDYPTRYYLFQEKTAV